MAKVENGVVLEDSIEVISRPLSGFSSYLTIAKIPQTNLFTIAFVDDDESYYSILI